MYGVDEMEIEEDLKEKEERSDMSKWRYKFQISDRIIFRFDNWWDILRLALFVLIGEIISGLLFPTYVLFVIFGVPITISELIGSLLGALIFSFQGDD